MTKIATIVQNSAEIVNIVSLKQGDVYKRIDETYNGDVSIRMGIVTGILNDGVSTAVTAIEVKIGYNEINLEVKLLTDKKSVAIFPATPDEVKTYFTQCYSAAYAHIEKLERDLAEKKHNLKTISDVLDGWDLSIPEHRITNNQIES